jgi:hypothetical protein
MARATPPKPWKPGQSGNPKGRPKGTGFAGQAREALAGRLPEILEAVVNAALNGDMQAARIILERTVPSIKPTELPIEGMALPAADATLTQQATDILAAATRGEVAPAQAAQLIASIGQVGKLMETDELRARIERLEAAHGNT